MYRVIVTGGREYSDRAKVNEILDDLLFKHRLLVIIEGGCRPRGADHLAAKWAEAMLPEDQHETHFANWTEYGKMAGHLRNFHMASLGANLCIAFPGGRGTEDMKRQARKYGIRVREIK
jgi:hypothetical protein